MSFTTAGAALLPLITAAHDANLVSESTQMRLEMVRQGEPSMATIIGASMIDIASGGCGSQLVWLELLSLGKHPLFPQRPFAELPSLLQHPPCGPHLSASRWAYRTRFATSFETGRGAPPCGSASSGPRSHACMPHVPSSTARCATVPRTPVERESPGGWSLQRSPLAPEYLPSASGRFVRKAPFSMTSDATKSGLFYMGMPIAAGGHGNQPCTLDERHRDDVECPFPELFPLLVYALHYSQY